MNKHAYLIMAHNEPYILEKLLLLLDDKRNDIYLHIDKKSKDLNFDYFKNLIKHSNIYFVKRMNVKWGTIKQIKCEIMLLESAIKGNYSYYHFISGVDLPIKSIDYIYNFFEKSQKEFVGFDSLNEELKMERIKYYNILGNYWRSKNEFVRKASRAIRVKFINLQELFHINRVKNLEYKFRKGANWFSITNNCAKYILTQKSFIKRFRYSYCADELFLQTLIYNSRFKNELFFNKKGLPDCLRYTDWKKGNPAILKSEDYQSIISSGCMFARKFSTNVDKEIINNIYNLIVVR